jgi:poly(A) polymerase
VSRIEPAWLKEPAVRRLLRALAAKGIEARFVGGCVRDALLGIASGDIDLATPARPEAVIATLKAARIKAVPTGLAHGTVTAIIGPRTFEITTLRRDIETDGRHAVVAFDAGWDEDAARRDFTINAIYLNPDGTLHDPAGGRADLAAHRVRFVGDPKTRIAEDVLRILRYYRFEARFGGGEGDAAARAACREAVPLLPALSAERVSRELMRLLMAPDPIRVLTMMRDDGVLAAILPEATRIDRLARLIALRHTVPVSPLRLAALIEVDRIGAVAVADRLRLSGAVRDRLTGLALPWPLDPAGDSRAQRLARYQLGRDHYRDLCLLAAAEERLDPVRLHDLLELADDWTPPDFPLSGNDVTGLGIPPGPQVGKLLREVRRWWEDGDFAAGRDECLAKLKQLAPLP